MRQQVGAPGFRGAGGRRGRVPLRPSETPGARKISSPSAPRPAARSVVGGAPGPGSSVAEQRTRNAQVVGSNPTSGSGNLQLSAVGGRTGAGADRLSPPLRPLERGRNGEPSRRRLHRSGMSQLPELWNVDRLAEYLGASKSFVCRLTREHRICFLKVGKELRFRPEDVASYLEAESVPAVASAAEPVRPRRGRPRDRERPGGSPGPTRPLSATEPRRCTTAPSATRHHNPPRSRSPEQARTTTTSGAIAMHGRASAGSRWPRRALGCRRAKSSQVEP